MVNNVSYNEKDSGSVPEPEDPLEEEMATHSSIHAWKIPWTEGSGGLQSMGVQKVRQEQACTHVGDCNAHSGKKSQQKPQITEAHFITPESDLLACNYAYACVLWPPENLDG